MLNVIWPAYLLVNKHDQAEHTVHQYCSPQLMRLYLWANPPQYCDPSLTASTSISGYCSNKGCEPRINMQDGKAIG